jgi:hypothetical protein
MTKRFVIKAVSGISGNCNLGDGATEKAAWEDAFGPKPWTPYTKRAAKQAWCEETEEEWIDYSGH